MVRHIDVLGILFVVWGLFQGMIGLVLALIYGLMGAGMGAAGGSSGDQDMMVMGGFMGVLGMVVACSVGIFAIPNLFTGLGLRRRARWSRIAGLVLGALAIPSFPLGTALGIYALIVLVDHEVGLEFEKVIPSEQARREPSGVRMKWRRGTFKDQRVWVAVDADGRPSVADGRVAVRYNEKPGATVYRAGAARVTLDQTGAIAELDEGTSADDAPKKTAASRGSGFGSAGTRTQAQAALARDAAKTLLAGLAPDVVRAFTDGACKGNPGPAGCGAVVVLPGGRRGEASQSLGVATNNVGELCAVGLALDLLDEAGVSRDAPVALFSDSSYANGVLVQNWKAKANADLIGDLRKRIALWPNFQFEWVAGHVGIAENERADALANDGVAGRTRTLWSSL